jgi:hypothetical protein
MRIFDAKKFLTIARLIGLLMARLRRIGAGICA